MSGQYSGCHTGGPEFLHIVYIVPGSPTILRYSHEVTAELDCSSKYCAYGSDHPLYNGGTKNEEEHGTIHT